MKITTTLALALTLSMMTGCTLLECDGPIAEYLPWCEVEPPIPPVDPPVEPPTGNAWVMKASFLRNDASKPYGRMMGLLSKVWSDDQFEDALDWHKAQGDNTLFLAFADQGDNAAPVEFYKGAGVYVGGGEYDMDDVRFMRTRLGMARSRGLKIVAWLTMDDSPAIGRAGTTALVKHAQDTYDLFDDQLDAYCGGLEIDEDGRKNASSAIAARLNSLTDKPVFIHYTRGDWRKAKSEGYDGLMDQAGFGLSYSRLRDRVGGMIAEMKAGWPEGLYVIAEYDRYSNKGYGPQLLAAYGDDLDGYGNRAKEQ